MGISSERLDLEYPNQRRHLNVAALTTANETLIFQILLDVDGRARAEDLIAFQTKINAEDAPLIEAQSSMELPLNLRDEVRAPADRLSIEYRGRLADPGLGAEAALGVRAG